MNMIKKYPDLPMSLQRAKQIISQGEKLVNELEQLDPRADLPEWLQAQIERAWSLIDSAHDYLEAAEHIGKNRAVAALEKARGTKFKFKRWTGKRWAYEYERPKTARSIKRRAENAIEGSAFVFHHKGRRGHFHVESIQKDGRLKIVHDETGHEVLLSKGALKQLLLFEHREHLKEHAELKQRRARERGARTKTGTHKGAERRAREAAEDAAAAAAANVSEFIGEQPAQEQPAQEQPVQEQPAQDNFDSMPENVEEYTREQQKAFLKEASAALKEISKAIDEAKKKESTSDAAKAELSFLDDQLYRAEAALTRLAFEGQRDDPAKIRRRQGDALVAQMQFKIREQQAREALNSFEEIKDEPVEYNFDLKAPPRHDLKFGRGQPLALKHPDEREERAAESSGVDLKALAASYADGELDLDQVAQSVRARELEYNNLMREDIAQLKEALSFQLEVYREGFERDFLESPNDPTSTAARFKDQYSFAMPSNMERLWRIGHTDPEKLKSLIEEQEALYFQTLSEFGPRVEGVRFQIETKLDTLHAGLRYAQENPEEITGATLKQPLGDKIIEELKEMSTHEDHAADDERGKAARERISEMIRTIDFLFNNNGYNYHDEKNRKHAQRVAYRALLNIKKRFSAWVNNPEVISRNTDEHTKLNSYMLKNSQKLDEIRKQQDSFQRDIEKQEKREREALESPPPTEEPSPAASREELATTQEPSQDNFENMPESEPAPVFKVGGFEYDLKELTKKIFEPLFDLGGIRKPEALKLIETVQDLLLEGRQNLQKQGYDVKGLNRLLKRARPFANAQKARDAQALYEIKRQELIVLPVAEAVHAQHTKPEEERASFISQEFERLGFYKDEEHLNTHIQAALSVSPEKALIALRGANEKLFEQKNRAYSMGALRRAPKRKAPHIGMSNKEFSELRETKKLQHPSRRGFTVFDYNQLFTSFSDEYLERLLTFELKGEDGAVRTKKARFAARNTLKDRARIREEQALEPFTPPEETPPRSLSESIDRHTELLNEQLERQAINEDEQLSPDLEPHINLILNAVTEGALPDDLDGLARTKLNNIANKYNALAQDATNPQRITFFNTLGDEIRKLTSKPSEPSFETMPEQPSSPARAELEQVTQEAASEVAQGEDRFETMPESESAGKAPLISELEASELKSELTRARAALDDQGTLINEARRKRQRIKALRAKEKDLAARVNALENETRRRAAAPTGEGSRVPSQSEMNQALDQIRALVKENPALAKSPEVAALLGGQGSTKPVTGANLPDSELVITLDGKTQNVAIRYKVIEAGDAIPSHDAGAFFKRPDYPSDVQEREYHDSNSGEQEKVILQAKNLNPLLLINTNPDAMNGPPILDQNGRALGGNSRVMSVQRAYMAHPERAQEYKDYLEKKASTFGLSAEDIAGFSAPLLVREYVVEDQKKENLAKLVRAMNEGLTQEFDLLAEGRNNATKLLGENDSLRALSVALRDAPDDSTLNDVLKTGGERWQRVKRALFADGILTNRNMSKYLNRADGTMNDVGVGMIRSTLLGYVVRDDRLMRAMSSGTIDTLTNAFGRLAAVGLNREQADALQDAVYVYNQLTNKPRDKGGITKTMKPAQRDARMNEFLLRDQGFTFREATGEEVEDESINFEKIKDRVKDSPLSSAFLKILTLNPNKRALNASMKDFVKLVDEDQGGTDLFGSAAVDFTDGARQIATKLARQHGVKDGLYKSLNRFRSSARSRLASVLMSI